jgi:hypothetical protein
MNIIKKTSLALSLTASVFAMEEIIISTSDRGDGKSGFVADLFLNEALFKKHNGGHHNETLMVRTSSKANNPGILRFDLSLIDKSKISSCTLKLFCTTNNKNFISVYGLKDNKSNEEFFHENKVNWISFAGLKGSDGDTRTTHWDSSKSVKLGQFKNPYSGHQWVSFNSEALTKMILEDTNDALVIMLQGGINTSKYSTKEGDPSNAPQLLLLKTTEDAQDT